MSSPTLLSLFLFSTFAFIARSQVPANETFTLVNEGEFGPYVVEYFGDYRMLPQVFASPFQLGFYNTTPNAFTLALRMGLTRSESLMRWVWEANRGNPVGENATFSLKADGNLVLAGADGRVAWQTNTANKGVVGFTLLSTGNMVLYDAKGSFVWQSFDSPTDTLLIGQSLVAGKVSKLVSRASATENKDGAYSLVLQPKGLFLYYKSSFTKKSLLYSQLTDINVGTLTNVTFQSTTDDGFVWDLGFLTSSGNSIYFGHPKFNGTLTYLRLGIDGNIRLFTYYGEVDKWEQTFTLFDRDSIFETECQLPERCGSFGVCENNQCVACPTDKGLSGWSASCTAEKVTSCDAKKFHYYKVEGVDHFLSKYNRGSAIKEVDCGKKCSSDCKCLGYFYNRDASRCLIAYELKTLTKVINSTHVGFIKALNQ